MIAREGVDRRVFSWTEQKLSEQPVETTQYSLDGKAPAPLQRRQADRHLSLLRAGALVIDGQRELCLIKNVSAGGMLIRAYSTIDEGTYLSIELRQGEPLNGTVRWVKDDCIGVTFDAPVDVLELISVSVDGPRQRLPRVTVDCTAWVREGATMHRARTVNVSQGGLRVTARTNLPVGADLVITLVGMAPVAGVLRWQDEDQYGISFNRPLPLPVLVAWLRDQQDQIRMREAG